MIPDLLVAKAQYPKSFRLELPVPHLIRIMLVELFVLLPVQFDHQRCRPAVKVYNVFSDHPLPVPVQRVFS